MEYKVVFPRFAGDWFGEIIHISDFSDLLNFVRKLKIGTNHDDWIFKHSTLESLLDSTYFHKSTLEDDCWIYFELAIDSYCGETHYREGFWDYEFVLSSHQGIFIHTDDAVHIVDIDDYVTFSEAEHNFYEHSDGCFYSCEEKRNFVSRYHSGDVHYFHNFDFYDYNGFLIGIEFEKEDETIRNSIEIELFERKCRRWKKEEDGSLDCKSGFELISPIYPLIPELIIEDIESNSILLDHVKADTSERCGGHINLSHPKMTSDYLFDRVKYYLPLLYAMYPKRRNVTYCVKKKIIGNEVDFSRKYSPIAIKSDRIEFRIFSAIKNTKQLSFRLKLVKMMAENVVSSFDEAKFIVESYKDLFFEVYAQESFEKMMERINAEIAEELTTTNN